MNPDPRLYYIMAGGYTCAGEGAWFATHAGVIAHDDVEHGGARCTALPGLWSAEAPFQKVVP